MTKMNTSYLSRSALAIVAVLGLSACTSIGYRCPLDPSEKPESATACAGMGEAMSGAKLGTGGKTSVLLDEKGRLVPPELLQNRTAKPLTAVMAAPNEEPFRDSTGEPVLHKPRLFQVWSAAFVDDKGNLHDGHHSWFATPSRWAYGTVNKPGLTGDNTMVPAMPGELPKGRILPAVKRNQANHQVQVLTQAEQDKAALQNLSNAVESAHSQAQQKNAQGQTSATAPAVPAVTAPSMGLGD